MRYLTTALLLICLSQLATAQNSVNKIILINGIATEVVITESGDIEKVMDIKNNYMSDFEALPTDNSKPIASASSNYPTSTVEANNRVYTVPAKNYVSSDNDKKYSQAKEPTNIK